MSNEYNEHTISARMDVARISPKQNFDVNERYFELVAENLDIHSKVLDIGTGNGFVLSEIVRRNLPVAKLYGIDNSKKMVRMARMNLAGHASIIRSSADLLPFRDENIDLVTAKNVTRINMNEVFRVLKPGGTLVFREYGRGKGMREIAELFPGRIIRQRGPEFYADNAKIAGLKVVLFEPYLITREYKSPEELITIVQSFPFIEDFEESDAELIIEKCRDAVVTSDPFIMVCRKE